MFRWVRIFFLGSFIFLNLNVKSPSGVSISALYGEWDEVRFEEYLAGNNCWKKCSDLFRAYIKFLDKPWGPRPKAAKVCYERKKIM